MSKEIPLVNKEKPILEQLNEIIPYSLNLLLQEQMGLPHNEEKIKNAKFAIASKIKLEVLSKETELVNLARNRFNFSVLELYGTDEQKKQIKDLFDKSFDKIKFIE